MDSGPIFCALERWLDHDLVGIPARGIDPQSGPAPLAGVG